MKASIPDLIAKKAAGIELTEMEIQQLVAEVCSKTVEDSQLGALLMAIKLQKMSYSEVSQLTKAMMKSGDTFTWPKEYLVGDKHSTGGVGDKVSLALAPALAVCGLKVPMISGRGLGHTGGTLDKLESIPGYRASLSKQEIHECVDNVGCCIVGQTSGLVPADSRMYKTRDVTATVDSLPLIVSSIMSKKAAEGITSLVLDVKIGRGSFCKTPEEAEELAKALVSTGELLGIHTTAVLTCMDAPLGCTVGNALEVLEALECLSGKGPADLQELIEILGAQLLKSSGLVNCSEKGIIKIRDTLNDGSALQRFMEMLKKQGVSDENISVLSGDNPASILPKAELVTPLKVSTTGVITEIDAMIVAKMVGSLGAGRAKASDPLNYAVGLRLKKVVGDKVNKGETWAEVLHDQPLTNQQEHKINSAITVDANMIQQSSSKSMILNVITIADV